MCYTYKNGLREGVVFAFINNNKILVEHRYVNNKEEVFFTSGSIEDKDYNKQRDYKVECLFREVKEEFQAKININNYVYLNEVIAKPINIIFYVFLITDWAGEMPSYTYENNQQDCLVTWEYLSDYKNIFEYDTAYTICERIKNYITKGERDE